MKRNSFNVLFFIKKAKLLKNGEASVCMRITVNGARVETNIRKSIYPASWNQAKECARGKSRTACALNAYIENHWHGATADSWFAHLAIEAPGEKTSNKWLEPVTDEEYNKLQEEE